MKLATILMLTAGLLLADDFQANPDKSDKEALQGTWKIVSVEIEGEALAMDNLIDSRLTVKGDDYLFVLGQTKLDLTFKMDASKSPKEIDLTAVTGPNKGKTYRGIYTLEGDTYKICRNMEPELKRPTRFATQPKSGLMMVVWQRVK